MKGVSAVAAVATIAATAFVGVLAGPAAPAQAAPSGPAWTCSAYGYLFQSPDGNTGAHSIYQVDLVSGASSEIATTPDNVNGVGYNTLDNYMYGEDFTTGDLVGIAADGTLTTVGTSSGVGFQVGDFDNAGHLYLMSGGNGSGAWIEVDLAPGSATYGQTIASGTAALPATAANLPSDWVYVGGSFYGLATATTGATAHLLAFNATTHAETDLGAVAGTASAETYGAGYADAAGNLYFSDNETGAIIRIDPTTRASIALSTGPMSIGNDGARCATAPIPTITVTKTVDGRAAAADQFTVGLESPAPATVLTSATTTGTATTVSTTDWPVSQGTTYTVTDAMAAGSSSTLVGYSASAICTDGSGNPVTTGGTTGAWTFTVNTNDAYTCNVTNTANKPAISIVKHAGTPVDVNNDGLVDAGDTIAYTFTVTNAGNVPLTDVGVTDAKAGAVTCPDTTLAAGASETCTADSPYTITTADVTNGSVDNSATAQGTPPGTTTPTGSTPSTTSTPTVAPAPSVTVVKTASAASITAAGQAVTYSFLVTNTGNEALSDVAVDDSDFSGTGILSDVTCPETSLAVGADEICTATYTSTQADVDAGGNLSNTATATGTTPGGDPVPSGPSTITVPVAQTPGLSIVKTASPNDQSDYKVGEVITYSFAITNTGNVTETNVAPDEGDFSGTGAMSDAVCPAAADSLAPGAAVTCTATYTVTQADVDAGTITNAATATGTNPGGDPTGSNTSTVTVPTPQSPSLVLLKTSDVATITTVGQAVTYSFTITNTGDVTETNVHPAEGAFNGSGVIPTPTCPTAAASLAPGDSVTCTAVYHVTSADLSTGTLANTATAVGTGPNGDPTGSTPSTAKVTAITPVAPAGLAVTGSDSFGPMAAGAGLVLLGMLAFLGTAIVRRRRRGNNGDEPITGIEELF